MDEESAIAQTISGKALICSQCGNAERCIEVMEHVENLVDADRNHLHLLIGVPDFYHCCSCGVRIDFNG